MITTPENLVSANKASVETFLTLANTLFAGTERLAALNLNAARASLEDSIANSRALLGAKDVQQLLALQSTLAQPSLEKFVSYARNAYEIASQTQGEIAKLFEAQLAEGNKNLSSVLDKAAKNAPAGSDAAVAAVRSAFAAANTAYDKFSKATKDAVGVAEANMTAATNATVKASGAVAKMKKVA